MFQTILEPLRKWIDGRKGEAVPADDAAKTQAGMKGLPGLLRTMARGFQGLPGIAWLGRAATWLLELGTSGYPPDVKIRL